MTVTDVGSGGSNTQASNSRSQQECVVKVGWFFKHFTYFFFEAFILLFFVFPIFGAFFTLVHKAVSSAN